MKNFNKSFLIVFTLLTILNLSNSYSQSIQVPNGDFENWEYDTNHIDSFYIFKPVDWTVDYILLPEPHSVFNSYADTDSVYSGNYALTNYIDPYTAILAGHATTRGICTTPPTYLNGYFRVKNSLLDSLPFVFICFNDTIENLKISDSSNLGGSGFKQFYDTTNQWKHFSIKINYKNLNNIDSFFIYFGYGTFLPWFDSSSKLIPSIDSLYFDFANSLSNEKSHNNFQIYPNPTNNNFSIIRPVSFSSNTKARIYDIQGKLIKEQKLIFDKTVIDIKDFSKGVYFVKIKDGDGVFVEKVVKN